MGVANGSINFSAVTGLTSGTSVLKGDVLVLGAAGADYVLSTTANRGTKRSSGVAVTNAATSPGGSCVIQGNGEISAAVTGLPPLAGPPQYAVTTALGRIARSLTSTGEVIGFVDEFGNAHVNFAASFSAPAGASATNTTATFVQPAASATVSVPVGTSDLFTAGQYVNIPGGGRYTISSIPDTTHIVVTNLGLTGNAAPAVVVSSAAIVTRETSTIPVPLTSYDPRTFGCPWDGIHDDTPGWNAMMAAIPKTSGARIDLPPGMGYFASDCAIKRYVHIHGRGGGSGQDPLSGIRLAPLRKIDFQGALLSDDGGAAVGVHFEFVDVLTKAVIVGSNFAGATYRTLGVGIDVRVAGTFVEIGTCVLRAGATVGADGTQTQAGSGTRNAVMFRCSVNGTPTGADPAAFATKTVANIGDVITDTGGVSWVVEGIPKDLQASHGYLVGERWYVPGDNRFIYECTIAGTSDTAPNQAANASYVQPQLGTTFVDGTVTCKVIVASPIFVASTAVHIRHCNIFGGFGFGVHLDSGQYDGTRYIFCEFSDVHDVSIYFAGGGVHLHGPDTNGGSTRDIRYAGCSLQQRTSKDSRVGTGEFCVWDRSQGGSSHYSNYSQFGKAPAYVCDSGVSPIGNVSIFEHCHSENVLGDLLYAPCIKIGTGIQGEQAESSCMLLTSNRVRHLTSNETVSAKETVYEMQTAASAVSTSCISAGGDITASQRTAWWTDKIGAIATGTGWLCRGVGPSAGGVGGQTPRAVYGTSYYDCKNAASGPGPGIGLFRIYDGFFGGRDIATGPYEGLDVAMLTNQTLRYGLRKVGDRFAHPSATHLPGTFRKVVCTVQGYRAPRWTSGTVYGAELGSPYFTEAVRVEPTTQPLVYSDGTGKVWEYVSGPANTGTEPVWTVIAIGSTFVDAGGTTWKYIGLTATFVGDDLVQDPGATLTTTNNTANQVVQAVPLTDNATNYSRYLVTAYEAASGDGASFELRGSWAKKSTAYIVLKAPAVTESNPNTIGAAWAAVLARNGTNIEVQVTGDTGKTIVWKCIRLDQERQG